VSSSYEILDSELGFGDVAEPSDVNFTFSTSFVADGTSDVIFRFTNIQLGNNGTVPDPAQDFTVINGFAVVAVPEPSMVALVGAMLTGVALIRRRR
jgi:hypothetical protein